MAALDIGGVVKRFGAGTVLDRVDLAVRSGDVLAILGASGSGKTTLLRLIAGFDRVDAGSIAIDGVAVANPSLHVPPERRRIGYLAQEGALFPHLSVGRNIAFGLGRGRHDARIVELLAMVGLPADFAARSPHQLSGGEQQRVALARALAASPRLVMLDEPFSALDATLRQDVRQTVATALKATGATAILVTHDQAEALSMGDRVAVLRDGRIVQHTDPASLYHRPRDAALAQFVGEAVLLPAMAHGAEADCALGTLALAEPMQGAVTIMIRPEQIRPVPEATAGSTAALIEATHYFGHDALIELRLADAAAPMLLSRVFSHTLPHSSGRIGLLVEGTVAAFPDAIAAD
ncbi:ABC transporter ATP-binding protein [Acidiphilium sp. AL]|uniref:ABC transporter ATP-binding protein n=1 Tax=Acidiphilium iwatense TaxID=768198 RepID=A0ABS9DY39_9PROT|nr:MULTISPECIES: ABC transporter ATP-binding protein [Acidiphilium]MCF3947661.1 ABC transporter ATP-binding protein [Acidiphilium iwatense]MCU4160912.1 ABC transporter ATP-binding protein [Acidiphilium sp. AL]